MEKEKIILIFCLLISILLFIYSLIAIFNADKINDWHEKSLLKSNNIFSKYALKQRKKNKDAKSLKFTGFVALIMSIIMVFVILDKLFGK